VQDAERLEWSVLREKYKPTFNSWKSMIDRRRREGAEVAEEFRPFRSFLALVGPRPGHAHTLDRLDPENPKYGPGLVAWVDKRGQANNRLTTRYLTIGGRKKPLTVWAEEAGVNPSTVRNRLHKGWSDIEAVYGAGAVDAAMRTNPFGFSPWLAIWPDRPDLARFWEDRYWSENKGHSTRAAWLSTIIEARLTEHLDELRALDASGEHDRVPERKSIAADIRSMEAALPIARRIAENQKRELDRQHKLGRPRKELMANPYWQY